MVPTDENTLTRPEVDLLIACGRKTFGPQQHEIVERTLQNPLDWSFILNQAQEHCVLPFLAANLSPFRDRVPAEVRSAAEAVVRAIAARNLALTGELIRLVRILSDGGIRAIPFKGPAVAVAAYGDQSLRPFADLDILVDPRQFVRARDLVGDSGYAPTLKLTPREERIFFKTECAFQMEHLRRGFVVELHWRLFEPNASVNLPMKAIRNRCTTVSLCGETVPSLAVEDLLLYLCIHGAKHCWERLEWISCVAELVSRCAHLDWPAILSRARRYRTERFLYVGLWLATNLFGIEVPEAIGRVLQSDPKVELLGYTAASSLFSARSRTHREERAAQHWFMLTSRERLADKVRFLVLSAFKPPHPDSREWIRPSAHFAFLNHVLRPVRLLTEYSAVTWRRYCGGGQ